MGEGETKLRVREGEGFEGCWVRPATWGREGGAGRVSVAESRGGGVVVVVARLEEEEEEEDVEEEEEEEEGIEVVGRVVEKWSSRKVKADRRSTPLL